MELRLNLDDTNFDALTESARAMIPALAREWTDHNLHDPGITLIDLMAWVAEAQIYSLARSRVDERRAFARLLGIARRGPQPARGLVWPLEPDEPGYTPHAMWGQSIEQGAAVSTDRPDTPLFRVTSPQHMSQARLERIASHFANGTVADHTRLNCRNGASYLPFGTSPTPDDRLVLTFAGTAIASGGTGTFALGVELSSPDVLPPPLGPPVSGLQVSMRDASGERPLSVLGDSTHGLMRGGVILLDIGEHEQMHGTPEQDRWFELILRPRVGGLVRAPRVRRIAANVLQLEQAESITEEEPLFGLGMPGQNYQLNRDGLISKADLVVEVAGTRWSQEEDFGRSDPTDQHFRFDESTRRIVFGNGINGEMPTAKASLMVSYEVCAGVRGNAPPGVGWSLQGVSGTIGRNSQPCVGGTDAMQLSDLRREARSFLSRRSPLVTALDLEAATVSQLDLCVQRARELATTARQVRGTRTLLVVAKADSGTDSCPSPENPRWLETIRARLAPNLLAGQRLVVIAPHRVRVRIAATLRVSASTNPGNVIREARRALQAMFSKEGNSTWDFGRDLTRWSAAGCLRGVDGVLDVAGLMLYRDGVAQPDTIELGETELPCFDAIDGDLVAERVAGSP
ncbi:putative baseplate assembly protein [Lysobacter rhizosphaerae]